MLPNRREGLGKSAPKCKILKKGSGWKSLSQSWLRPWTWTLEIWISSQPWPWTSSSISICLLLLPNVICLHCAVYKTLWGKQLALAMLLCNTAHNRILVLPQVCWPGSNKKKKKGRKGVNTSKSVKIFKDNCRKFQWTSTKDLISVLLLIITNKENPKPGFEWSMNNG